MARQNDMITIEIGPLHTTYRVHRKILLYHSEYFRKALQGCWKEGEEGKVIIEDLKPLAFDVFVNWLYTGKIPSTYEAWAAQEAKEEAGSYIRRVDVLILQAYVVADRLVATKLLNAISNFFVDANVDSTPYYEIVIYAFKNIPAGRRVLALLIDTHCRYSEESDDVQLNSDLSVESQLPHDFLLRVMKRYRQTCKDRDWDRDIIACDYHEHTSEDKKAECKRKAEEEE
jgi:hypothetical protein